MQGSLDVQLALAVDAPDNGQGDKKIVLFITAVGSRYTQVPGDAGIHQGPENRQAKGEILLFIAAMHGNATALETVVVQGIIIVQEIAVQKDGKTAEALPELNGAAHGPMVAGGKGKKQSFLFPGDDIDDPAHGARAVQVAQGAADDLHLFDELGRQKGEIAGQRR